MAVQVLPVLTSLQQALQDKAHGGEGADGCPG